MPDQGELFNRQEGQRRRDAAMQQVEANAQADWKVEARAAICSTAKAMPRLTSDDVWQRIKGETHERRALGPLMLAAARDGILRKTGLYTQTAQTTRHAAPIAVWESLIFSAPKLPAVSVWTQLTPEPTNPTM